MTYWIITEILQPDNPLQRALHIQFFLNVGNELIQLKCFNASSVLTLAVQHPSILRLTHTWELITDATSLNSLNNLKRLFLLPLLNPRQGYYEYWNLQRAINPPFVPFFRILLEEISFENTSPEDPTLTTRSYTAQIKDNRFFVERTGPKNVTQRYLDLIASAKEGSYPEPNQQFLVAHLANFKVMDADSAYERSRKLQPRLPPVDVSLPKEEEEEDDGFNYVPYVVLGIGVLIGLGVWFKKH